MEQGQLHKHQQTQREYLSEQIRAAQRLGNDGPIKLLLHQDDPQKAQRMMRFFAYLDRKSTRLNSSHVRISYAVFCLKKKKKKKKNIIKKKKNKKKKTKKHSKITKQKHKKEYTLI